MSVKKKDLTQDKKFFQAQVKAFNDMEMTIDYFISTEARDRSNDIVRADGMRMDGIPTVLKQHGKDPVIGAEPIAKPLSIEVAVDSEGNKGILVKTKYYDGSELTPPDNTGKRLYEKAKNGFMPYFSIGFGIEKAVPLQGGGKDIQVWWLFEYSQVGVPDNPTATTVKDIANFSPANAKPEDIYSFKMVEGSETPEEDPPAETQTKMISIVATDAIVKLFNCDTEDSSGKIIPIDGNDAIYAGNNIFLVGKDNAEEVRKILVIEDPVGLKSLSDRIATQLPYESLFTIWYAFVDEIGYSSNGEKEVKSAIKELVSLITPHALAFNASLVSKSLDDKKEFINKCRNPQPSVEPAPEIKETETDNPEPPAKITQEKIVLRLKQKAKPKRFNLSKADVQNVVKDGMKILNAEVKGLQGKI